jgi:hypothetical protein
MKIDEENTDSYGWFDGLLRTDGKEDYRLTQEHGEAYLGNNALVEDMGEDTYGEQVILRGMLEQEEKITGNTEYWLRGVDAAAIVLEEDFSGWTVGVAGENLVFTDEDSYRVEKPGDSQDFQDVLEAWFSENSDQYLEAVEELKREADHWPWIS